MPSRNEIERLQDILDAAARLQSYCSGISFEDFLRDWMRRDAVERQFIRLGEAAIGISEELVRKYPKVPWHEMRGMRNWVTHVYWGVDASILWRTVQHDITTLVAQIDAVLAAERNRTGS